MIPTIPVQDAIARLDRALEQGPKDGFVVATDGDGTLWTSDIGEALFEHVLEHRHVGGSALEPLLREADEHGVELDHRGDAVAVARALFSAYVALRYPEDRMCAAMAWCMAGMRQSELDALSNEVLETSFGLRDRLIDESFDVLRWAGARDVPVWLVSASPRAIVVAAARIVGEIAGIPTPSVIAMTPRIDGGIVAADIEGIWPYGEGKRTALEASLRGRAPLVAMGDNVFDVPMLAAARFAFAIRPKPALVQAAGSVPGLRTLVR